MQVREASAGLTWVAERWLDDWYVGSNNYHHLLIPMI